MNNQNAGVYKKQSPQLACQVDEPSEEGLTSLIADEITGESVPQKRHYGGIRHHKYKGKKPISQIKTQLKIIKS